jgi:DNA-binding response OmpR family regulator
MRILVVEDDPKISSFVAKGLQDHGHLVETAADGKEGLARAQEISFDVIVADLMMPELDGLGMIVQLRSLKVASSVVVLSAKRSVDDKVRCLRAGADDYLAKPFAISELLARIESVVRRTQKTPEVQRMEADGVELDLLARLVRREGRRIDLQPREFSLLELLMRNRGRALSKAQLLEKLWDYSFDPQTNIVDVLICRLRNKLDRDFNRKLIHTLRGVGYVFRSDD